MLRQSNAYCMRVTPRTSIGLINNHKLDGVVKQHVLTVQSIIALPSTLGKVGTPATLCWGTTVVPSKKGLACFLLYLKIGRFNLDIQQRHGYATTVCMLLKLCYAQKHVSQ